MLKALKIIVIGLVGMVVGIIWIAQPGHQGNGGGIALALVDPGQAKVGTQLEIQVRNRRLKAEVVKPPFV